MQTRVLSVFLLIIFSAAGYAMEGNPAPNTKGKSEGSKRDCVEEITECADDFMSKLSSEEIENFENSVSSELKDQAEKLGVPTLKFFLSMKVVNFYNILGKKNRNRNNPSVDVDVELEKFLRSSFNHAINAERKAQELLAEVKNKKKPTRKNCRTKKGKRGKKKKANKQKKKSVQREHLPKELPVGTDKKTLAHDNVDDEESEYQDSNNTLPVLVNRKDTSSVVEKLSQHADVAPPHEEKKATPFLTRTYSPTFRKRSLATVQSSVETEMPIREAPKPLLLRSVSSKSIVQVPLQEYPNIFDKLSRLKKRDDFNALVENVWRSKNGKHDKNASRAYSREVGTKFSFAVNKDNLLTKIAIFIIELDPRDTNLVTWAWAKDDDNLRSSTRISIEVPDVRKLIESLPTDDEKVPKELLDELIKADWRTSKAIKYYAGSAIFMRGNFLKTQEKKYYCGYRIIIDWAQKAKRPDIKSIYPAGLTTSKNISMGLTALSIPSIA